MDVMIHGKLPAGVTLRDVRRAILSTFSVARQRPFGGISVACVSEAEIRRLNRIWRKRDRSTNVLSFAPARIPQPRDLAPQWGDIVLSPAFIARESRQRGISKKEELLHTLVHGALHLLGYDHGTKTQAHRMFLLQEQALQRVGAHRV